MFEKLPQFLKDRYLFCRWKYEQRDNGVTKVPYQVNGHRMRAGYRAYYTDFANASADLTGFDGIGK